MRRLLAAAGAVAMVVAAVAVRARLDAGEPGTPTPGGPVRIVCATEVAAACEALRGAAVEVEPAGTTAARLAGVAPGEDPGLDGWIVPAPWPQLVDERRRTRSLPPLLETEGRPLARSPLRLVVARERAAALAPKCPGAVTWRCLGEAAADGWWRAGGRPEWGPLKPGHAPPTTDGVGLLVTGQAVAGWFGRTDLATIDLDTDDGFARWFSALEKAVPSAPPGSSPLNRMLLTGAAEYDAVGTTEAEVIALGLRPDDPRAVLLYPEPMATADVVLATAGTTAARSARRAAGGDTTRRALAAAGWWAPDAPASPVAAPALPPGNGLPSAGLLLQVQDRWRAVTGR